jgi:uncharacterized protein (TIGR02246 family)
MSNTTPADTVASFIAAMNRGDAREAAAHYEEQVAFVAEPGVVVTGRAAAEAALAAMLQTLPRLSSGACLVLVAGDIALYHADWHMSGSAPDGSKIAMSGHSADVLRRQPDGTWRVVVDNPWGTQLLTHPH